MSKDNNKTKISGLSNKPQSKWSCQLFGLGPNGIVVRPLVGERPNWFWRWMQYLLLGNRWIKDK